MRPVKGGLPATRRARRPPASAPCSYSQPSPRGALALTLKHHFAFELREAGEDGVALLVSTVSPARLSTRTLGRPRRFVPIFVRSERRPSPRILAAGVTALTLGMAAHASAAQAGGFRLRLAVPSR